MHLSNWNWGWSNRLKYNSVSDENIASLELYFINWLRININNCTKINNYSDGDKEHTIKYLVYWASILYMLLFFSMTTSLPVLLQSPSDVREGSMCWLALRAVSNDLCGVIQRYQAGFQNFACASWCLTFYRVFTPQISDPKQWCPSVF